MFLKRLEIQGFKSFADFVSFDFSKGVSAIVGPNGSGKSNVVDAVRWVLGEQSAKSLRGGKMEDVIFSGSKDRKPLGMAKVTLVLDNTQGTFDLPFNEVSVSRVLHRSGESLYHLNGKNARLKDIQELFMDTGLGKDGFSVIGQGKIDEILTLHAEERRGLIEEAAGISKYKYRKKEASRKLESIKEDLTRLEDILLELESQLAPLEKQADDVRAFHAYDKEYQLLSLKLLKTNYDKVSLNLKSLSEKEEGLSNSFLEAETLYETNKANLLLKKEAWQALRLSLKEVEEAYTLKRTHYETLSREIDVLRERSNYQALQINQFETDNERLALTLKKEKEEFSQFEVDLDKEKLHFEGLAKEKGQKEKEKKELETQKAYLEEKLSQCEVEYFELMRKEVGLKNHLQSLEEKLNSLHYQKARQGKKESLLNDTLSKKEAEKSDLEKLAKEANEALIDLEEKQKKLESEEKQLKEEKHHLQVSFENLSKAYTAKESRLLTLNELESSGEGYFFGVSSILKAKEKGDLKGILGTVSQLIQVDERYEVAIENALGGSLQYLVTEDEMAAKAAINYLKARKLGKATFLPLTTIRPEQTKPLKDSDKILGYGSELVSYEPKYHAIVTSLLAKTVIVTDIDSALALQKSKIVTERMVTLSGEVISPKGSLTGGMSKKSPVLLKRGSEKRALEESLRDLKKALEEKKAQVKKVNNNFSHLEAEKMKLQETFQTLSKVHAEKVSLYESLKREAENEARRLKVEQADFLALVEEEKNLVKEKEKEKENLSQTKTLLLDLEKAKKETAKAHNDLLEGLEGFKAGYYEADASLKYGEERYQGLLKQFREKEERIKTLSLDQIRAEESYQTLLKEKKATAEKGAILSKEKEALEKALKADVKTLDEKKNEISSHESEIEQLDTLTSSLNQAYHEKEKAKNEVLLKINQEKERFNGILNILEHDFEATEKDLAKVSLEGFIEKEAKERKEKLKGLIKGLGELNFTAIEAYEEVLERTNFMTGQLDDLKKAESQLLKLIKEMEDVMSERFKETYAHVNTLFNEIFQGMFHGGRARLELSMPKNYLETGIEIIAEPPGKRERILSLLSGGERAMTAIALLFALLNIKPSPFVILDEIEAALDEANVDHLADFIKNYSKKSQFIVISHRKGTMEASDILYGVSMDKDGVSKLLSVRLEDFVESEG